MSGICYLKDIFINILNVNIFFLSPTGNLVEAVKKKFVFLEDSCLPQTEVVYELEQAVGHKVTKVQAFDVVQKLGKIDKKTSRIGSRKDAIDRRQRMYL